MAFTLPNISFCIINKVATDQKEITEDLINIVGGFKSTLAKSAIFY